MYKCKICSKEFKKEKSLYFHVAVSFGKEKNRKHCSVLEYKAKYENNMLSEENIRNMYLEKKMSAIQIADILKIYKYQVYELLKLYSIKTRTNSEASKLQFKRNPVWNKNKNKYEHTSIKKYAEARIGKNNPFYTAPHFEERYKKNAEMLRKVQKRFGTKNPASTEKRMIKILDSMPIQYIRNFSIKYKTTWRTYDFLIENKFILEVNGDYWHANPKYYNKDYIVVSGSSQKKAEDIWLYDKIKRELAIENGYRFFVIWEQELISMSDKEMSQIVEDKMKA